MPSAEMRNATAERHRPKLWKYVCDCALSTDFGRRVENLWRDSFLKLEDYGEPAVIYQRFVTNLVALVPQPTAWLDIGTMRATSSAWARLQGCPAQRVCGRPCLAYR